MEKQEILENIRRIPNTGPRGIDKIKTILKEIVSNEEGGGGDSTSVVRTTPQELTFEQQEVALSNLGMFPLTKIPDEHWIQCGWGFDCETHCFDSNTLDAIKSIPDGDSFDDQTYKYLTYSNDDVYCIIGSKYTNDGYISIELYPYVVNTNYINTFEGLYISYDIDESTGEIIDCTVRDGNGYNERSGNLSILKNSMIVLLTSNNTTTVTAMNVQYKGFLCYCLVPAVLLILLRTPAISFTGMLPRYLTYDDWQDFVPTVTDSNRLWTGVGGGAVAVDNGKLFAGGLF